MMIGPMMMHFIDFLKLNLYELNKMKIKKLK
jgi:hypothetical protein